MAPTTDIELKPLDDDNKKKSEDEGAQVPFKKLFTFATHFDYILIFFGAIASCAASMVFPGYILLFGEVADTLNEDDPDQLYKEISRIAALFMAIGGGAFFAHMIARSCWMISAERQVRQLRLAYLNNILRQDMYFFDENGAGGLSTRLAADSVLIQEAIGEKFGQTIQYTATFIATLVIGLVTGWKLTLVILSTSPVVMGTSAVAMSVVASLTGQSQKAYSTAGTTANEMISGIRTVVSFNLQGLAMTRYRQGLNEALRFGRKKSLVAGVSFGTMYFAFFASYTLGFWYGGKLTSNGEYSGRDVLIVFFSALIASFSLGQAGTTLETVMKGKGAASKLFEVMERRPKIDSQSTEGLKPQGIRGDIEFKNVTFRYPSRPDAIILNNFSLKIPHGKKVALVGPSGSGKSSLIALMQRFYDTESGQVTVDDNDVTSLNIKWLRQQYGLVGQEPVLFSGTIADNISFGNQGLTQQDIETAAKAANAHSFITGFPDGYLTEIGEKGAQLSGGQKQRIAIARAIITNPQILLLDEATSALDTESEKIVQQALDQVSEGRTTIMVAHRLATVRHADIIVVVSKGQVAEQGNHEQLMELNGIYADLVRMQSVESDSNEEESDDSSANDNRDDHHNPQPKMIEVAEGEVAVQLIDSIEDGKPKRVPFSRLLRLNRPEAPQMIIGVLCASMIGIINPAQSILFGKILESYYKPKDEVVDSVLPWALAYIGLAGGMLIGYTGQGFFLGNAGQKLVYRCRDLAYASIMKQNIGWFDSKTNSAGNLTSRLASHTILLEDAVGTRIGSIVTMLAAMSTSIIISFIYGWELAWVLLLVNPLFIFASVCEYFLIGAMSAKALTASSAGNQVAAEAISNVRTVASYTNESVMVERYNRSLEYPSQVGMRTAKLSGFLLGVSQLLMMGANAVSFWYGGKLIRDGKISFGDMITIYGAVFFAAETYATALAVAPNITKAQNAANVIFQIIDRISPIDPTSPSGLKKNRTEVNGELCFHNVRFAYPTRPKNPILKGLNLTMKPGQVTALVGSSGCGKSSSVGLLERWYDPSSGSITMDGVDLREYNVTWLREQIGIVGQEPVLFSGTIADNIRNGLPNASQEDIETAAKSANAHDFITNFPDGYNTEVGERGTQLSGGQKQRIAIARAIVKNPKVLLLDEATSALDNESEKIVQDALNNAMEGRTTLVIAHRLTTIRSAHKIACIHNGRVIEEGTHEELMQKKGHYFNLVSRQVSH